MGQPSAALAKEGGALRQNQNRAVNPDVAFTFSAGLEHRSGEFNRDPHVKFLPGQFPIIAGTELRRPRARKP